MKQATTLSYAMAPNRQLRRLMVFSVLASITSGSAVYLLRRSALPAPVRTVLSKGYIGDEAAVLFETDDPNGF